MKTYGVNWFLVWVGHLVVLSPTSIWLRELLRYGIDDPTSSQSVVWVNVFLQVLFMSMTLTFACYFAYGRMLADPSAVQRQRLQRRRAFWNYRYRWLLWWAIVFTVVTLITVACKVVLGWPSWSHVVGESILLPGCLLAAYWLLQVAARNGQLARFLKADTESPS